jgi:hypothetical protein
MNHLIEIFSDLVEVFTIDICFEAQFLHPKPHRSIHISIAQNFRAIDIDRNIVATLVVEVGATITVSRVIRSEALTCYRIEFKGDLRIGFRSSVTISYLNDNHVVRVKCEKIKVLHL